MLEPIIKVNNQQCYNLLQIDKIKNRILHHFSFENKSQQKVSIEYRIPIIDFQYIWHPLSDGHYSLKNEWDSPLNVKINRSLPVICFFNQSNKSQFSFAVSELIGEINIVVGVHEESACMKVIFEFLIPNNDYSLTISFLANTQSWSKVIQNQVKWLYEYNNIVPKKVPASAYQAVLSTWYSFHQSVSENAVYHESINYKNMGISTLILDDGWQTNDGQRRYSYAGDWKVSEKKFPKFKEHIKKVQSLDMKYLIWLSLPYIGVKAQNWDLFQNDLLYFDDFQRAGVLDIRNTSVKETLSNTVKQFINNYPVDGLKLDFFETFFLDENNNREIAENLLILLEDLESSYPRGKDFLIEYRQDYINPLMMQFANIVRAKDCPNNLYLNRIRTIDLRLCCPYTAVHSDMIMWNQLETIESMALQLINVLFSVPQISMKYDKLSIEEKQMIKFWIEFTKQYQKELLHEQFVPLYPHEGYSQIHLGGNKVELIINYSDNKIIEMLFESKEKIIINGSDSSKIFIKLPIGNYELIEKDCSGNKIEQYNILVNQEEIKELRVTKSGLIHLQRI